MMKQLLRERDLRGFTLIELVVVLIIIAIVATIGIPTFLSLIERSRLRAIENTAMSFERDVRAISAFDIDKSFPLGVPYNHLYVYGAPSDAVADTPATGNEFSQIAADGGLSELPDGYVLGDIANDTTDVDLEVIDTGTTYAIFTLWKDKDGTNVCDPGEYSALIAFPASTGQGETAGTPAYVTASDEGARAFFGAAVIDALTNPIGVC